MRRLHFAWAMAEIIIGPVPRLVGGRLNEPVLKAACTRLVVD
jgi:hypothetical protein